MARLLEEEADSFDRNPLSNCTAYPLSIGRGLQVGYTHGTERRKRCVLRRCIQKLVQSEAWTKRRRICVSAKSVGCKKGRGDERGRRRESTPLTFRASTE